MEKLPFIEELFILITAIIILISLDLFSILSVIGIILAGIIVLNFVKKFAVMIK